MCEDEVGRLGPVVATYPLYVECIVRVVIVAVLFDLDKI